MTPEQRQDYANCVWAKAQQLMGVSRLCSPAEYDLIYRWMEAEIPLAIVLRGMADTAGKGARSLLYFEPGVLQAVEHWRKALQC